MVIARVQKWNGNETQRVRRAGRARFSTVIGHSLSFGTKSEREEIAVPVRTRTQRDARANFALLVATRSLIAPFNREYWHDKGQRDRIFFVYLFLYFAHCHLFIASLWDILSARDRVRDAVAAGWPNVHGMCVPLARFTLSIAQSNISLRRLHSSFASFRENGIFLQRQHCIAGILAFGIPLVRRSSRRVTSHSADITSTGSVGYSVVSSSIIRSS